MSLLFDEKKPPIIDLSGNAYRPPKRPTPAVVEVDDDDEEEEKEAVEKEVKTEWQIFAPGEIIELDLSADEEQKILPANAEEKLDDAANSRDG